MEKIKLNDYQNIFYFVWNNTEETIKTVNEYLKLTKGSNWSCGRAWDEKTRSNTSDTLFISEGEGEVIMNSFYYVGEYVVDFGDHFWGLNKEDFNKGDFIKKWKEKREQLSKTIVQKQICDLFIKSEELNHEFICKNCGMTKWVHKVI